MRFRSSSARENSTSAWHHLVTSVACPQHITTPAQYHYRWQHVTYGHPWRRGRGTIPISRYHYLQLLPQSVRNSPTGVILGVRVPKTVLGNWVTDKYFTTSVFPYNICIFFSLKCYCWVLLSPVFIRYICFLRSQVLYVVVECFENKFYFLQSKYL